MKENLLSVPISCELLMMKECNYDLYMYHQNVVEISARKVLMRNLPGTNLPVNINKRTISSVVNVRCEVHSVS